MNDTPTTLFVSLIGFLLLGLLVFAVKSKRAKEVAHPDHSVTVHFEDIPVFDIDEYSRLDSNDFVIVKLKDGHDYWFFKDRGGDKGYAAMTHCQECKKCAEAFK